VLILTRRKGEILCIGDDITVVVIDTDRGNVKIGISAPKGVVVDRSEVRERKQHDRTPCRRVD